MRTRVRTVGTRVRAVALAIAFTALSAACSGSVSGHGSTAAVGAPAAGSAGSTPSGFPSIATSGGSAAVAGVSFAYPQGHFRATFPATPQTRSEPGTVAGASYTLYVAQTQTSNQPTLLACEDISVKLPTDQDDQTLRGAVGGFEGSSGLTLEDQQSTTFRGHVARQAHFSSQHGTFTFLATLFTDQRLYLFFAPTGAPFDTLTSSFQTL